MHTVNVPADHFHPELVAPWGQAASASLTRDALQSEDLARATGLDLDARAVWPAVLAKLEAEPIKDLRVDLEDGYGTRSAWAAHPGPDAWRDPRRRSAARELGGQPAKGHLGRPGPRDGGRLRAARAGVRARRQALRFETQVETPQAILLADGAAGVATMLHAAAGRCTGLHFGTYDYTAALGISGGFQAMDHPAADHAKAVM